MLLATVAALALALPAAGAAQLRLQRAASATATVELATPRQVIDGFGSSERSWTDPHLAKAPTVSVPPAVQAQILSALYRKLGLTMVRDSIDAGIQSYPGAPYNFAAKADAQAAFVRQAHQYGLKLFFPSPVYLEAWMQPNDPGAYVDWAMALLQRWRALGATPPYYSVLNEPQIARDFPPRWLHDVVVQLGQRLRAAGFKTKLVIPDDENPIDAYTRAQAVLQDPQARQYVGALAFHIYRIGGPSDWARLRQLATQYRLPLWMTEYESPSYGSYGAAFDWAVKMHQLLTVGGVNAIDYLWGFFGDWVRTDTMISIHFANGVYQEWSTTPIYDFVGQYSKYVRPGYRRVASASDDGSVLVTAYTGRNKIVVVATNTASSPRDLRVRFTGGRTATTARVVQTTSAYGLRALVPTRIRSARLAATLPAQSVTTFIAAR